MLATLQPARTHEVRVQSTPRPRCYTNRPRVFRARRPHLETVGEYSARLLRYALCAGLHTLDADQRALVDMAAQRAISQLRDDDGRASRLSPPQLATAGKLSTLRHQVAQADRRARANSTILAPPGAAYPQGGGQGGRLAPLLPPTPTQPPAGSYADARPILADRPRLADGIRF